MSLDDELRTVYGDCFLQFALASEDIHAPLTPGQEATLSVLQSLAKSDSDQDSFVRYINLRNRLGYYVPEVNTTVAWNLHQQSGGDFHRVQNADKLIDSLLVVARDMWPTLLLPQSDGAHFVRPMVSAYSHPATHDAIRLVLADDALQRIFLHNKKDSLGNQNTSATMSVFVMSSTGSGGGLQPVTVPDTLLGNARSRQLLRGRPESIDDYLSCVVDIVAEARRLAYGKEIVVPRLVGLTNMELDTGTEVATPFGTLRPPTEGDAQLLAKGVSTLAAITAIVETTIAIKLFVHHPDDDRVELADFLHSLKPTLDDYQRRADHTVEMIRLAVLMSSPIDNFLAPAVVSHTPFVPLQHGLAQGWSFFAGVPSGVSKLDTSTAESVRRWAEKIEKNPPRNIELGIRRLISAATTRTEHVDGFIDAVVCWENMFGAAPETMFRVCAAMARLIESTNKSKRTELFKELKRLYTDRSAVVHGSLELDAQRAYASRNSAIRRGLEAVRRLYDFPYLLAIAKSHERSQEILLASEHGFSSESNGDIDE